MKWRSLALLGFGGWALYRLARQLPSPRGVVPCRSFDPSRLSGRWYEIARIDLPRDCGPTHATVEYRPMPSGRLHVVRRELRASTGRWHETTAMAQPVGGQATAHLQLSTLWPLRSSHIVFALDEDGQHALISGPSHDHLWLLSRTPHIKASTRAALLDRAREAGFDTDRLLWVDQRQPATNPSTQRLRRKARR